MSYIFEISEIGLMSSMQELKVISNNIANSSNTGFRRDVYVNSGFNEILSNSLNSNVTTEFLATDMRQGSMKYTGGSLDVAIQGDGYFQIKTKQGVAYTRNGSLTVDSMGQLTTKQGYVVQGVDGDIRLTTQNPTIDESGKVWELGQYVGQISLVKFPSYKVLQKTGEGNFTSYMLGEQIESGSGNVIKQKYLEGSNVNAMHEMVSLTSLVRKIEAAKSTLSAYDDMMKVAINDIAEF